MLTHCLLSIASLDDREADLLGYWTALVSVVTSFTIWLS